MPSIHDFIDADPSKNKDLNSFPKNDPQESPDDPVELYETTIKIVLDNARRAGQITPYKESFLAIEVDKKKSFVDGEGSIRLFVGNVVHPGDSGFDNGDFISIPRSDSRINRWNTILIDRFYITAPGYGGTFPAERGVVDDRMTRPTDEEFFGNMHYEEEVKVMHQELNQYATSQNTDEPIEPSVYDPLIELFRETLEYWEAYDKGWKDSYLGIHVTAVVNDGNDIEGRVVHPGDSCLWIGKLIRITPTSIQEKRWNCGLKNDKHWFYVTSPSFTSDRFEYICISEPEDVEADDIQKVEPVVEQKHQQLNDVPADLNKTTSNTIDFDYIRNRDKRLDSCMKSIRSMIDVVDEKLFKVKFNQFIGSLKISKKIKEASDGDPEEVKEYYQALRMFYAGPMHKKKMENAVKYYDRDMEVFKSLHGIANRHNLAHKKWF